MFKNKKFSLLGLIFVIFIFTACSSNKEISELFKKSKKVNNIQSYVLVNEIDYENKGNVKNQMMKAKLINDKDTKKLLKEEYLLDTAGLQIMRKTIMMLYLLEMKISRWL